jgi:hypothetical protein
VGGDGALLERDHELGVLDGLLGSALAGGPAFALIEGPPEGRARWLKGTAAGATRVFEPPREEHAMSIYHVHRYLGTI